MGHFSCEGTVLSRWMIPSWLLLSYIITVRNYAGPIVLVDWESFEASIIDFPYHGSTYNGGWCLATETHETLIPRPSCEVNV